MDEARHHLAYRRFIDRMGEQVEGIDAGTEMMFDALLEMDDPLELIATEQFFLESFAMDIFEGIRDHATHPLLRRIVELITRDESRHMGFGVLYIAEWMRQQPFDRKVAFARRWLGQILGVDPGSARSDHALARGAPAARRRRHRHGDAGAPHAARAGRDQSCRPRGRHVGSKVPPLLKSARRAGLLEPDILEALGVSTHPLIRGALRGGADA